MGDVDELPGNNIIFSSLPLSSLPPSLSPPSLPPSSLLPLSLPRFHGLHFLQHSALLSGTQMTQRW